MSNEKTAVTCPHCASTNSYILNLRPNTSRGVQKQCNRCKKRMLIKIRGTKIEQVNKM